MSSWARRCALALAALPAPSLAAERVVRLVVQHEAPLLRSETRALAAMETALGRRKLGTIVRVEATPEEVAATGPAPVAALPAAWSAAGVVVVLQILPPAGAADARISRGLGNVLIFRPPSVVPVFTERVAGSADLTFGDAAVEPWLADMIRAVAEAP
jgi:hypothetical protein